MWESVAKFYKLARVKRSMFTVAKVLNIATDCGCQFVAEWSKCVTCEPFSSLNNSLLLPFLFSSPLWLKASHQCPSLCLRLCRRFYLLLLLSDFILSIFSSLSNFTFVDPFTAAALTSGTTSSAASIAAGIQTLAVQ